MIRSIREGRAYDWHQEEVHHTPPGQEFTGIRKVCWPNGDFYCGSWQGGMKNGYGRQIWSDNVLRTTVKYEGHWEDGIPHGSGCMTYGDGGAYKGSFHWGSRQGYGLMKGADGWTYAGEWAADTQHGVGRMVYANGTKLKGAWSWGRPCDLSNVEHGFPLSDPALSKPESRDDQEVLFATRKMQEAF